jgi:hypothetical protein
MLHSDITKVSKYDPTHSCARDVSSVTAGFKLPNSCVRTDKSKLARTRHKEPDRVQHTLPRTKA